MTIDEAIKTLENEVRIAEVNDHLRELATFQLSIEALKRVKGARTNLYQRYSHLLPGETES